jgi:sugar phosphate isomerase/epimerase
MRDLANRLDLCSINTATLGHLEKISTVIDAVARHGYGAICPWRRDLQDENVAAIARQIRDARLTVSGYCRSTYFPARTRQELEANIADNIKAVTDAATLGATCFVLVVGSLPEGSRDLTAARAQVEDGVLRLLEHAKKVGIRLALEPLHPMYAGDRSCLNTLQQALDLAEKIEPDSPSLPSLGVAVDVYHVWWDPDLAREIARAGKANRLFGYHVCDWLVPTRDLLTDRGMMGDGVIDLRMIRALMELAGYNGPVEVEIFSSLDWWKRPMNDVLAICSERLQTVC